jgi:hypothetical protein
VHTEDVGDFVGAASAMGVSVLSISVGTSLAMSVGGIGLSVRVGASPIVVAIGVRVTIITLAVGSGASGSHPVSRRATNPRLIHFIDLMTTDGITFS